MVLGTAQKPDSMLNVSPGIWSICMLLPSGIQQVSRTYLVDIGVNDELVVVDPAWPLQENMIRLRRALEFLGRTFQDISDVYSTHAHLDHFGLAGKLRSISSARTIMHLDERSHLESIAGLTTRVSGNEQADSWGVPKAARDRLRGGPQEQLDPQEATVDLWCSSAGNLGWSDSDWQIIEAPGHTSGSSVLVHHGRRVLFTGDTLLPSQSPGLGMGGIFTQNPLEIYTRSMATLSELDGYLAFPGHGEPFQNLSVSAQASLDHHGRRRRSVLKALSESREPLTVWQLAQSVEWRGGFDSLRANRLRSALRHVEIYRQAQL